MMMIKVSVGTATKRYPEKMYDSETTIQEVLEEQEIVFETAQVYANGVLTAASEINMPLSEFGADEDKVFRIVVSIKTKNALA